MSSSPAGLYVQILSMPSSHPYDRLEDTPTRSSRLRRKRTTTKSSEGGEHAAKASRENGLVSTERQGSDPKLYVDVLRVRDPNVNRDMFG
ncbi:hypothetical protein RhiJN_24622 [Ceratobasidium sp. AG-Ba]|nr:hypothetical protein RhiJN_24622 [Ceratobasidium sp. AG-Ba]